MIKDILSLILLFLVSTTLNAQQPPWTAKFIVEHPSGLKDTVWFGCDINGEEGYQTNLDIIKTTFTTPIKILS
jgi:hypothetical protein